MKMDCLGQEKPSSSLGIILILAPTDLQLFTSIYGRPDLFLTHKSPSYLVSVFHCSHCHWEVFNGDRGYIWSDGPVWAPTANTFQPSHVISGIQVSRL